MGLSLDQAVDAAVSLKLPTNQDNAATVEMWTLRAYTAGATSATVRDGAGTQITLPILRSYASPTVGDNVLVLRSGGGGWIVGALGKAPVTPPPQPPQPPNPDPVTGTDVFLPVFTGTYRGGWRGDTNALLQGDWTGQGRNSGGAYYGGALAGLAGATPTRATLSMRRGDGGVFGSQTPTMWALGPRSPGAPARLESAPGPGMAVGVTVSAWSVPLNWVTSLIGGAADGIGIHVDASSPYIRLDGRDAWSASFALTVDWRRDRT